MHIPNPTAILRQARRAYQYFHTGVQVEGRANRRHDRVTVVDIAEASIPMFNLELEAPAADPFESVTLEPGAPPQESHFVLVPKGSPNSRVESTSGAILELEFRPGRGSERWARPTIRMPLSMPLPRD